MSALWTPEVDQECYETCGWMRHPDLPHLCAAPNEQGVSLGAVAVLRAGGWGDRQRSTVVGFLCGGEDRDILAMRCFPQGEGCISASVRARGPSSSAAVPGFLLPPLPRPMAE